MLESPTGTKSTCCPKWYLRTKTEASLRSVPSESESIMGRKNTSSLKETHNFIDISVKPEPYWAEETTSISACANQTVSSMLTSSVLGGQSYIMVCFLCANRVTPWLCTWWSSSRRWCCCRGYGGKASGTQTTPEPSVRTLHRITSPQ